jgi:hypothetical protein
MKFSNSVCFSKDNNKFPCKLWKSYFSRYRLASHTTDAMNRYTNYE